MYFCCVKQDKTILVAVLNWGLGHATRCIPVINRLLAKGFAVMIASDGVALDLLKKEFPELNFISLPSYAINYPKNKYFFVWHFLKKIPRLILAFYNEKKVVNTLLLENKIIGIINDNRLGMYHKKIPSVYITHQLCVMSRITTIATTWFHKKIIERHHQCWIPDTPESTLSGRLSQKKIAIPVRFTGILSRLTPQKLPIKYDLLVLLSGPEPQRSLLEKKIKNELKNTTYKILLIQGVMASKQKTTLENNIVTVNYMTGSELEKAINQSALVLARSGYTTLLDLAVLDKKAFFIPTPGQFEQEYLANRMEKLKIAPYCRQADFSKNQLKRVAHYKGFKGFDLTNNLTDLMSFFKRE